MRSEIGKTSRFNSTYDSSKIAEVSSLFLTWIMSLLSCSEPAMRKASDRASCGKLKLP